MERITINHETLGILKNYPDGRVLVADSNDARYCYSLYNKDGQLLRRWNTLVLCPEPQKFYMIKIYRNMGYINSIHLLPGNELLDFIRNSDIEAAKEKVYNGFTIEEVSEFFYSENCHKSASCGISEVNDEDLCF